MPWHDGAPQVGHLRQDEENIFSVLAGHPAWEATPGAPGTAHSSPLQPEAHQTARGLRPMQGHGACAAERACRLRWSRVVTPPAPAPPPAWLGRLRHCHPRTVRPRLPVGPRVGARPGARPRRLSAPLGALRACRAAGLCRVGVGSGAGARHGSILRSGLCERQPVRRARPCAATLPHATAPAGLSLFNTGCEACLEAQRDGGGSRRLRRQAMWQGAPRSAEMAGSCAAAGPCEDAAPPGAGASQGERTMGALGASRRCRTAVGDCMVHRYPVGSRSCARPAVHARNR